MRGGHRRKKMGHVDWLQVEEATNGKLSLETMDIFKDKRGSAKRLIQ